MNSLDFCIWRYRPFLGPRDTLLRPHERAEDPENREEDSEEEHPPVPVPERHQAEREHQDEVQDPGTDSDSPPHSPSLVAARLTQSPECAARPTRRIIRSGRM